MFTFEHIVIAALIDISSPGMEIIFSRRFVRHIGSLIYFGSFALFFNNQSKPPLERIFRESLVSSSHAQQGTKTRGTRLGHSPVLHCASLLRIFSRALENGGFFFTAGPRQRGKSSLSRKRLR